MLNKYAAVEVIESQLDELNGPLNKVKFVKRRKILSDVIFPIIDELEPLGKVGKSKANKRLK